MGLASFRRRRTKKVEDAAVTPSINDLPIKVRKTAKEREAVKNEFSPVDMVNMATTKKTHN